MNVLPLFDDAPPQRDERGLASYLSEVAGTVRRFGPRAAWVRCEVTDVKRRPAGQVYLQLAEADEADGPARTDAVIWQDRAASVLGRFAMETGSELAAGMRVLLLVVPQLSPRWGFGLKVLDIDPAWTVGAAKLAAEAIRRKLQAEGLWDRNRSLPEPEDFTAVAVIAPDGSAGLEDFMAEIRPLVAEDLCRVAVATAPFEGPGAGKAVAAAVRAAAGEGDLDAVFILRGGGAAAALSWLNDDDAVRAVCDCPVPVIVGVGHEVDRVLLDEVANMTFGTPSKAAKHLVDTIVGRASEARDNWEFVQDAARAVIEVERTKLDALLREAVGLGPSATLARGYAVVTADGAAVASAAEASRHSRLEARFRDGSLRLQACGGEET